jgi:hypothetical protein
MSSRTPLSLIVPGRGRGSATRALAPTALALIGGVVLRLALVRLALGARSG